VDGARIVALVRDGKAGGDLAKWLTDRGWGRSSIWSLSALGGPRECIRHHRVDSYTAELDDGLVAIALEARGSHGLARSSGLSDDLFVHDGQITKRPVRALALSALAPRRGETLWDIGAGSGSISVEWALCGGASIAIEAAEDRAANIRSNASTFGLAHRITVMQGKAPDILSGLEAPDAVFVGGGLNAAIFDTIWSRLEIGARLVAHAVTLETEALFADLHRQHGGELMRVEIAHAGSLGRYRSWEAARPVVQWSAVR
jgi:precorrin-6B C5,15-methyltransferase / cobalt-precorrin-6B C5,C15-methyltransferase